MSAAVISNLLCFIIDSAGYWHNVISIMWVSILTFKQKIQ